MAIKRRESSKVVVVVVVVLFYACHSENYQTIFELLLYGGYGFCP